ncbi:MAG TPA: hypothetical protein PK112_05680, partial [candidate division Zixibacteria bacterium]|nr:hypothetical protein [candidate division Zixibacteria bacterium]
RGNADGDPEDRVTVSDLLHLIHYVFRGQAGLPCLEEANINGSPDGIIDVADVNLLIAHLYREDQVFLPAPCQ